MTIIPALAASFLATPASASTFHSTYTGIASFNAGGEQVGKKSFMDYQYTATYTYDTSTGTISTTPAKATYTGPIGVSLDIDGTIFDLEGSNASAIDRQQTMAKPSYPYNASIASDAVFTGPSTFSGDYVASGISFLYPNIPISVTTPFERDFTGPLTLDDFGSFSFKNGSIYGYLAASKLVVSEVPLPASAPLFAAALVGLGLVGAVSRRNPVEEQRKSCRRLG